MIFVALGTQKFQMNRLIEAVDVQKGKGLIKEEIFAQSGNSDYMPRNFESKAFLNSDEFNNQIEKSDIVITHSGVSTIIKALMLGKKVIVVPRLAKFGEHVDNHQMEIAETFSELNYVFMTLEVNDLYKIIEDVKTHKFNSYVSGNDIMIDTIKSFLANGSKIWRFL